MERSPKSYITSLLLCFFLGSLGIHRFYAGKTRSGIFMLLTLGGLYVWQLIDLITLLLGRSRDRHGRLIQL
ncbi:MAG: hypothetical protein K1060chlam2_01085 [Chlamydiae bacterium]|nr:hypothetical protein [Chlamydiota bacterium]